jgi:hypothetical protein
MAPILVGVNSISKSHQEKKKGPPLFNVLLFSESGSTFFFFLGATWKGIHMPKNGPADLYLTSIIPDSSIGI